MALSRVAFVPFVCIAGLAGCGGQDGPNRSPGGNGSSETTPTPSSTETPATDPAPADAGASVPSSTAALADVDANLDRLRALDVFEVGDLVVALPAEALNCYGAKPCAGSEAAVSRAKEDAAERLVKFTYAALAVASVPYEGYACDANVDVNLETLRALSIVEIGALIQTQAPNDPNCYNQPCPDAVAAANQANHERAAKLENIATSMPVF